jgi:hypothetical protein
MRYYKLPQSTARQMGVEPGTTVGILEVSQPPMVKKAHRPTDRTYKVTLPDGSYSGNVYSLSGWKLAKHP